MALTAGCERTGTAGGATPVAVIQRQDMILSMAGNDGVQVAGTQDGALLISSDGGNQWRRLPQPGASFIALTTCPDHSFLGIDFYHRVWHGDAKADKWISVALAKPQTPLAVACDAQSHWWVAGTRATIAGSTDQGATWKLTQQEEDAQITALQMGPGAFGIALGEFGLTLVTRDGGHSWIPGTRVSEDFYPYSVLFTNDHDGYVSGIAGQIMQTHDAGRTWKKIENPTGLALYHLTQHGNGVIGAGMGGALVRIDGGSWQPLVLKEPVVGLVAASMDLGSQNAMLVGGPGGLLKRVTLP
jgi:photosystem II stability/assembly factor-like uncharacterized protein